MDRVYKLDIPAKRKALEQLSKQFSTLRSTTDWKRLRVEPLLAHARSLERLLRSPRFARETSRLPRGVAMFHSDLVYLRENIKALQAVLEAEGKPGRRPAGSRGSSPSAQSRSSPSRRSRSA
jgi:hypothetical protein